MTSERLAEECAIVDKLVGGHPESWDLAGLIPEKVLRDLGTRGLLCPQIPQEYGGIGFDSLSTGEFTAHVGSLCSSLRSVMTSQGMAAWTIQRLADIEQRHQYLAQLASGQLAAVGFSEPQAGSDLSAIDTTVRDDGDSVILTGQKVWMTAAHYADLLVVFCRYGDDSAAVVVPTSTPGVHVQRVADPLGCRAAGHANVLFDSVRLPMSNVLGGAKQSLALLATTALTYGRISVAWGCVGILRACLAAASSHARSRQQFGKPLAEHQLVGRHLAELLASEQIATRICEHASRCWDSSSPDMAVATVLAKHVSASQAVKGAAAAVQVLASAGAQDGHLVARAYRDAKLMEIIEGSTEICQLILAQHALTASL
ncbi:acyl-CoA dehydrogenase family protein [Nocardia nepalensis]|uniref:acyl-CoA dehydrogenase family protein n=1 Tax=Nocardia nepalensis TaxID=3375448 RepID=UPI003B682950